MSAPAGLPLTNDGLCACGTVKLSCGPAHPPFVGVEAMFSRKGLARRKLPRGGWVRHRPPRGGQSEESGSSRVDEAGPASSGPATLTLDRTCLNLIGLLSPNGGVGGTRYFHPHHQATRKPRMGSGKAMRGGGGGFTASLANGFGAVGMEGRTRAMGPGVPFIVELA